MPEQRIPQQFMAAAQVLIAAVVLTQLAFAIDDSGPYYVMTDTPIWARPLSEIMQTDSVAVLNKGTQIKLGSEVAGCSGTAENPNECRWQIINDPPQYRGLWIQTSRLCTPHQKGRECPFNTPPDTR